MINGPEFLRLESRLKAATLSEAAAIVGPLCSGLGLTGCSIEDGAAQPGWPVGLPPTAKRLALAFGESNTGSLHPAFGASDAWQFNLDFDCRVPDTAAVQVRLAQLVQIAGELADSGALIHVAIYRHAGGLVAPIPPLADVGTHLVSATAQQVAAAYYDPAAFVAAWDRAEQHALMTLYVRALDKLENPAFLAHVLPGQRAMAQAAQPGQVRWAEPSFAAGEFELLDAGTPTLTGVGYNPAERSYEFAGYLPEGADLRPIDLMLAARVASEKTVEAADGKRYPVELVRAVFDSPGAASHAAPLLRSAGVQSCYMDDHGDLVSC
jgi:hypothetical protein